MQQLISCYSCDYCFTSYSEDNEVNDYLLTNFTIAHDEIWVIPFIKAAMNKSRVPIQLLFSPWVSHLTLAVSFFNFSLSLFPQSPPAWMKINGMMNGSSVPQGLIQNTSISYFLLLCCA